LGLAVVLATCSIVAGCATHLAPDKSRAVAYVTTNGTPSAGLVPACTWKDTGLPRPTAPATACPHEREEFEAALGLKAAEACGDIRRQDAPRTGDLDHPVGVPIAPHCYALGARILVVEYEERATTCSHIVGMAFLKAE